MHRPRATPTLRGFVRCTLFVVALAAAAATLAQRIDDVPPAVQNNVPPNFMFMIDNSGSMNNIVPGPPFSASTTYGSTCGNVIAAGASVDLRVVGGVPRIRFNNTTFRHASAAGTEPVACFNPTATYGARLLADAGTNPRTPGSYLDSEYSGNYLNWYFGNFDGPLTGWTDRKRVTTGSISTRMEIARRSAKGILDTLPLTGSGGRAGVRVGLSTYRGTSDGGALRVAMQDLTATSRTALKADIDQLTPVGATPLATTLADIGRYLATGYNGNVTLPDRSTVNIDTLLRIDGSDNAGRNACLANSPVACASSSATAAQKPIQYWCQRSSIIAMTDGRPQNDRGFNNNARVRDYDRDCTGVNAGSCVNSGASTSWDRKRNRTYESEGSDYMDDVAKLLFDVDWRPDITKPATSTVTNNIRTYMIGFADPTVQNDPLLINTARQGGGRFIAASSEATLNAAFRAVLADALAKDAAASAVAVTNTQITAGSIGYASSYNAGSWYGDLEAYVIDSTTGLQKGEVVWHARDRLEAQDPAARKIASWAGGRGVAFTTANGSLFRGTTAALTDDLISYTRGVKTLEGTTFRARAFRLGDIINAEPVVVNYASDFSVVYQAANDGMLHVFDGRVNLPASGPDTRGQELWAYVPGLVHSKLAGRADPLFTHQFLVDGTPGVSGVSGFGDVTRILVGGLGKGGSGYYALNITSAAAADEAAVAAKALWEVRLPNMGYSFGTPLIVNTAGGWKVVVTSGYRNDAADGGVGSGDSRGHVWVLHPLTGAVEKEFTTADAPVGGTIGLAHLAPPAEAAATVRYLYGGDLQGNLWRVDLNAPSGAGLVRVATVRGADGLVQPITVPPIVTRVPGSSSKFLVTFGTGQYFSTADVPPANGPFGQRQTIYGIVDDTSVAAPANPRRHAGNCPPNGGTGELVCQEATQDRVTGVFQATHNEVDLATKRGFYIDLPVDGGRVNTPLGLTTGGTLVVVMNKPSDATCEPGGSSFLLQLSATTGGAVERTLGGGEYYNAGGLVADHALSSRPVIVTTEEGPVAILRGSDKETRKFDIDEPERPPESPACATPPCPESPPASPAGTQFRRIYMRPLN